MLIGLKNGKRINLKIFLNGTVHLTGLKKEEEGHESINILIRKIKNIDKNKIKSKLDILIEQCVSKNTNNKQYLQIVKHYNNLQDIHELDKITKTTVNEYFKNKENKNDFEIFTKIFKLMEENKIDIDVLNSIHQFNKHLIVKKKDLDKLELKNFKICLINSDFCVGFKIKREFLFEILVNKYGIYATYEPDIYPGVNSKFYWNTDNKNKKNFGTCCCIEKCDGKGNGTGDGNCKKVTIAIFQSGKIIITGARNLEQVDDSYDFINKVLNKHYDELKRKDFNLKKTDELLKKDYDRFVYISSIKNFEAYENLKSLSQNNMISLNS